MARCKECLYYEVCPLGLAIKGKTGTCLKFKNKADFVKVVRCKNCGMKGAAFCMAGDFPLTKKTKNNFCSYGERKENEIHKQYDTKKVMETVLKSMIKW